MTDLTVRLDQPRVDCLYTPLVDDECSPYGNPPGPGYSIEVVVETLETLWYHVVSLYLSLPGLTDRGSMYIVRDDGQVITCEVDWDGLPRITFRADLYAFGANRFALYYR